MSKQQFIFEVFADHHQFYVQDGGINPEEPTDWTDEDVERRAEVADNVVVICRLRNMTVPVTRELHEAEPAIDLSGYGHAVECSVDLSTGVLQVHECTGSEVPKRTVKLGSRWRSSARNDHSCIHPSLVAE